MTTQTELEFRASAGGVTQNGLLQSYFLGRPLQWIPMPELAAAIHAYAVHSRVSDLRKKFGMNIEQKSEGRGRSFYRYIPNATPQ